MLSVRRRVVAATVTACVCTSLAAVPARASAPAASTPSADEIIAVLRAEGLDIAAVPSSTMVTFYAGLPRDSAGLATAARAASTPGSPTYRQFRSLRDVGRDFGATSRQVAALHRAAASVGLRSRVDTSRLFTRLSGTAQAWQVQLGGPLVVLGTDASATILPLKDLIEPSGRQQTHVPKALRGLVRDVIPSQTLAAPPSTPAPVVPAEPLTPAPQPLRPLPTATGTPGDSCLTPDQLTNTYTPAQLHTAYGTAALRADGMTGRGTRMTVLSLGQAFSPQLVAYAAQCFGYRAPRIQTVAADGVQGRLPVLGLGSEDESLLDLQVVAPILTGASSVRIVETPEAANLVESMVNGMATALNADGRGTASPDVVSVSYGECLDVTGATDAALGALGTFAVAEDLLASAALVGTSVFVASGDAGAAGCTRGEADATAQEVSWPSSSRWVTAVGGTLISLTADNHRSAEQVWNNAPWFGPNAGGAGGGPALGPRPWYQPRATPADRRIVPDLVAHASDLVGWPLAVPTESGGATIVPIGGTSASTPFVAANFALIAARERAAGRPPLGFVNPWLYALGARGQGFYDIAGSNNQTNPQTPCCVATRGFDQASGLGAPRFVDIAARIPSAAQGRS